MHVTAHACNMHELVACTVHVTCMFAVWYVNAWSIHVHTCYMHVSNCT